MLPVAAGIAARRDALTGIRESAPPMARWNRAMRPHSDGRRE
jgi:hypothetical protein